MSLDDINSKWMRVATPWKGGEKKTPKYSRYMLGMKGIGRFSVENLSQKTTLISYPEDETMGFTAIFEWEKYDAEDKTISEIENTFESFTKPKDEGGLHIILDGLKHKWEDDDVSKLRQYIRSMIPPIIDNIDFNVNIITDEFEDSAGEVNSDFLSNAVYRFESTLSKTGKTEFRLFKHGRTRASKTLKDTFNPGFACGPVSFEMYYYYRRKGKYTDVKIEIDDIKYVTDILDRYGNIKIYRDKIRISGFGNPDDDWIGLDSKSRNDPSIVPARHNIIAMVHISSDENPEITDTTTRENIIKNKSFQDMSNFINTSIDIFSQFRSEIEGKRQSIRKRGSKYTEKVKENIKKRENKPPLLDFSEKYPLTFYKNLEDEVNLCFASNLPNATLIMSRKIVENLLYHILYVKFPSQIELRYHTGQRRAHNFSTLHENLEKKQHEFNHEQLEILKKLFSFIKPFRREANSTTHKILEYFDDADELDQLKIKEIVELELALIGNILSTNG